MCASNERGSLFDAGAWVFMTVGAPWHFFHFLPLPHGQGSFRPKFSAVFRLIIARAAEGGGTGKSDCCILRDLAPVRDLPEHEVFPHWPASEVNLIFRIGALPPQESGPDPPACLMRVALEEKTGTQASLTVGNDLSS